MILVKNMVLGIPFAEYKCATFRFLANCLKKANHSKGWDAKPLA